jgi:ATP phosphoribosyltransferase regulatory subunit HisZ
MTGQSKTVEKIAQDRMKFALRISSLRTIFRFFSRFSFSTAKEVALKMSVVHAMRRAINELAPELFMDEQLAEARQYQKADKGRADASHTQRRKGPVPTWRVSPVGII